MTTNVLISIDDQHLTSMPSVVEQLESVGLQVHRALEMVGTVTGEIEPSRIPAVEQIEGVASVEAEREVQIAPPHSPVQ